MGDLVLVRKTGMNEKLTELLVGLFSILKVNSPLSYQVESGGHTKQTVLIQRLKRYEQRPESASVKSVTTVLEPDTDNDTMDSTCSEVVLSGQVQVANREKDIQDWVVEYADTLTKQPGLTDKATFSIETGEAKPIAQRTYNTPIALKASVDKELDWLLDHGYIRQSESLWASPMVTVRKPDGTARICVDFKHINEVTEHIPFYMPWVEEVLEAVGRSRVISKLDLSKGYYQVPLLTEHIGKTAFVCHKRSFEFLKMPFGVKNAPAVFQSLMTQIMKDCSKFARPYIDDVVIFSTSWRITRVMLGEY